MHFSQSGGLQNLRVCIFHNQVASRTSEYAFFTIRWPPEPQSMHFSQSDGLQSLRVCVFHNQVASRASEYAFFTIRCGLQSLRLCIFHIRWLPEPRSMHFSQ